MDLESDLREQKKFRELYFDYSEETYGYDLIECIRTSNNNNTIYESSNNIYYYYKSIKEGLITDKLSFDELELFRWFSYFEKLDYLKILYIFNEIGVIHISGIAKILNINYQSSKQYIQNLLKHKIIEVADKKDKNSLNLLEHLKQQRWGKTGGFYLEHWKLTELYKLSLSGELFFRDVPYSEILDDYTKERVDSFEVQLRKTFKRHRNEKKFTEKEAISKIMYRSRIQPQISDNINWIERQMELFTLRGTIFSIRPEELLEIVKRK